MRKFQQISLLLSLSFAITFISCKNDNEKIILTGEFPHEIELQVEIFDNTEQNCPALIIYTSGYLSTLNYCQDQFMQITRLSDKKSKMFITKGNGPAEFLSLTFSGHKQGDSIYFRNHPLASVWIHPGKLFEDKSYGINKIKEPEIISLAGNVFHLEDKWVFSDVYEGRGLLVFSDTAGNLLHTSELYPELSYNINNEHNGYVHYSTTSYNPNKEKFAIALRYFPYLIISDTEGNYSKIIQTQNNYREPVFKNQELIPDAESEIFYGSIEVSDKYIYLFRPNITVGDNEMQAKPAIEVYDWNGKAICRVKFDKFVGGIDFDFENGKIYGLTLCLEEFKIYTFESTIPKQHEKFFKN
jgi:hypothetical protein